MRPFALLDPEINTYSFRYGLSKYARSVKVDPWQLQAQLGHKSLGTTGRYATYDPDYLTEICNAIQSFYEAVATQSSPTEQKKPAIKAVEAAEITGEIGERGGTRTLDPMIKSHVLYRLSYALTCRAV